MHCEESEFEQDNGGFPKFYEVHDIFPWIWNRFSNLWNSGFQLLYPETSAINNMLQPQKDWSGGEMVAAGKGEVYRFLFCTETTAAIISNYSIWMRFTQRATWICMEADSLHFKDRRITFRCQNRRRFGITPRSLHTVNITFYVKHLREINQNSDFSKPFYGLEFTQRLTGMTMIMSAFKPDRSLIKKIPSGAQGLSGKSVKDILEEIQEPKVEPGWKQSMGWSPFPATRLEPSKSPSGIQWPKPEITYNHSVM